MAGEGVHQGVADDHAAGDTGRRGKGGAKEAGAAALEHAGLVAGRVLWLGRGGCGLVAALLRIGGLLLALLAPGVTLLRGALRLVVAAEEAAEEAAAFRVGLGGGMLLHGLLGGVSGLFEFPLETLELVLGLREGGLGHDRHLGDAVAGLGELLKLLGDEAVGLAVDGGDLGL